ncbi:MAG TPA: cbb3-type cytochrome c oxidase subunit II [Verrucomicrobiae bacterium]|nr:cbb3-type cytochrome c oxidase subunit II [Verrucomicrobiae bacterium]
MNHGPLLFLGVFFAMATSWTGMVLTPWMQIGKQAAVTVESTGAIYPSARPGMASQGAEVYRANGCAACHSMQVRASDAAANRWGPRVTVAQDYLYENPAMIGSQRIGPDLTNIGLRRPDAHDQLLHLYNPSLTMPDGQKSVMPPYPFLFEKRKLGEQPSPDALKLPAALATPGYEIVPRHEALALVAYLQSRMANTPLFEAPMDLPKPAEGTNAPAGAATNTPAK